MKEEHVAEKRGPIEKGEKGWPINPFGVVALIIIGLVIALFIVRPLISRTKPSLNEQVNSTGGRIIAPLAGEIVKSDKLQVELSVDEPQRAAKVQFWAKTYADGSWQMIGEVHAAPFRLEWQIPSSYQNKAVAITSHIAQKDGNIIKDPGGWREGIIILSEE